MAHEDLIRDLRIATGAIVNADTTMRTIMGRNAELIVQWDSLASKLGEGVPVIAVALLGFTITGEEDDGNNGTVQFSCFAQGDTALEIVDKMAGRLRDLLTSNAYEGQGLDVALYRLTRLGDPGQDRDETRGVQRTDLEVEMYANKLAAS